MNINLKDCFKLQSFKNAKWLVSTKKEVKLEKIVVIEEARAIDISDNFNGSNTIAISGFYNVKDDIEEQCKIIEKLAHSNLSVLVLHKVGKILKEIPDQVIELCKEKDLDLVAICDDTDDNGELLRELSEILYDEKRMLKGEALSEMAFELIKVEKHKSFYNALKAVAQKYAFQFAIVTEDFNPIMIIENNQEISLETVLKIGRENGLDNMQRDGIKISHSLIDSYWKKIKIKDVDCYCFIIDSAKQYFERDLVRIIDIIEIAVSIWNFSPEKNMASELITELRRANIPNAQILKDDMNLVEKDFKSIYFCKGIIENDGWQEWIDYCQKNNLKLIRSRDLKDSYGIVLGDCDIKECLGLYDSVKNHNEIKLFHITGISTLEEASEGFTLISESYKSAEQIFPMKKNFSKYDLTMARNCMNIRMQKGFLKTNFTNILKDLTETNKSKEKELLKTLGIFLLDANMSNHKTAEIMNLHSNTIQYRLKRIGEILGVDILSPRMTTSLMIALAILRLEE